MSPLQAVPKPPSSQFCGRLPLPGSLPPLQSEEPADWMTLL
jgi:hypothetical protein